MTLAVVVMAAAVEVSLVGLSAADSEAEGGGEPGMLEAVQHMMVLIRADVRSVAGGAGLARLASGTVLSGARLLFGGMAVWLTCFLAMRVYVVGIRRLGAAEWVTAGAVAALAAGAALIGPVRALGLFIFAGALLLALAALGSLLQELRRRGAASPAQATPARVRRRARAGSAPGSAPCATRGGPPPPAPGSPARPHGRRRRRRRGPGR